MTAYLLQQFQALALGCIVGFRPRSIKCAALQPFGKRASDEGHGFSRVPMSLRLTQGDENHLDSPIMILRGLEVVFDCAINGLCA